MREPISEHLVFELISSGLVDILQN